MPTGMPFDAADLATVKIQQEHEFLPLRACIIGNPNDNILPPYNEASRNYVDHFPERFQEAIRRMGDRPRRMSEVLPDLAQEVSAGLDRLEQVYRRHGVKVFRTYEAAPEIINYFGYAQTGYWSFGTADNWKVLGNVLVELAPTDNIRCINPQVFEYRDLIWRAFENTAGAVWVSMPPAAPTDPRSSTGRGPFVVGADIKVLDHRNILVGCGVSSAEAIQHPNQGRSAMNEDGVAVFRALAERLGYRVHQAYYDTRVSFHMDTIFGLVRQGLVMYPKQAFFVMPDYVTDNFEVLDVPLDECIEGLSGNSVPINASTIVVNAHCQQTIEILRRAGMTVEAVDYAAGASLGTGPWCSTCALWRE